MGAIKASEWMAEDEAMGDRKFCPLKPGDFVCIRVERGGRRLYGYGRVRTVSPRGVVYTYEGATGKTQNIREGLFTWALPADRISDPDAFMEAIQTRQGKPLESWNEALDFAAAYCKEPDGIMTKARRS